MDHIKLLGIGVDDWIGGLVVQKIDLDLTNVNL